MEFTSIVLAMVVVLLVLAPSVSAQNLVGRRTSGLMGVKLGVISRMSMRGDVELQSHASPTVQVFADFPKFKDFYLAIAFDFYYLTIRRSNEIKVKRPSQLMIEPCVGLKRAFYLKHADMILKPAVMLGFTYLADISDVPSSTYLSYKFMIEAHFKVDNKKSWIGELGLFNASHGNNGRGDVSLGPGVLLRVGVAFH